MDGWMDGWMDVCIYSAHATWEESAGDDDERARKRIHILHHSGIVYSSNVGAALATKRNETKQYSSRQQPQHNRKWCFR